MKTIAEQIQIKQAQLSRLKPHSRLRAGLLAELARLVVRQLKVEIRSDRGAA